MLYNVLGVSRKLAERIDRVHKCHGRTAIQKYQHIRSVNLFKLNIKQCNDMAISTFFKHVIALQIVVIAIMLTDARLISSTLPTFGSRSIDRILDTTQLGSNEMMSTAQNKEEPVKLAGDTLNVQEIGSQKIAPPKSPTKITFLFAGGDPFKGSGTEEDVKVMKAMMGYAMMSKMPRTEDNEPITEDIINRNIDGLKNLVDTLTKAGASKQDMVNLAIVLTANGKMEVPEVTQNKILKLLLDKNGVFKKNSKQMDFINDIANSNKQLSEIPTEDINDFMLQSGKWTAANNLKDKQESVEHKQHQKQSLYEDNSTNGFADHGNSQSSSDENSV